MAEQDAIDAVKVNLPADAGEDGFDDVFIGSLLDGGISNTKITLSFWAARVGKLSTVVDVTENGSSRQLSNLFNQAKTAYDLWFERNRLEDNPPPVTRSNIRFHTATRV